jgi:pimeloyl-ACP methyl ester carboxylesterase
MKVTKIKANGIDIAYEKHGHEGDPVVCLIQGLGQPLSAWPAGLIDGLTSAGLSVLIFDNRDIGQSQLQSHSGVPKLAWQILKRKIGLHSRVPYQLTDMMADTHDLLKALDIPRAHIVGISMGGMIAQLLAIHVPETVASLTSIMSTTGRRGLPGARRDVGKHVFSRPQSSSLADKVAFSVKTWELIASPAYPPQKDELREFVLRNYQRGVTAGGVARQIAAIVAASGREKQLSRVKIPTLVIHGDADPLVQPQCGIDTANSIPGATLKMIPGMGHDLPKPLLGDLAAMITDHVLQAEGSVSR